MTPHSERTGRARVARQTVAVTAMVAGALFGGRAWAAEILHEHGEARVVSGDWAVWTTRGIAGAPVPVEVEEAQVRGLLGKCMADELSRCAAALARGLAKNGWAQFEREPLQALGEVIKVRVRSTSRPTPRVMMERFDLPGNVIASAVLDLQSGVIDVEHPEPPESPGRTVFDHMDSPEDFVLYQEHFQKQFFESMLNLDHPGLEAAREAYRRRHITRALYEVAEYARRKTSPKALIRRPAGNPSSETDPGGEQACEHIFSAHGLSVAMGPNIQWDRHPEEATTAEWLWRFNCHNHFGQLLQAYLRTANEKYVSEFVDQVTDFIVRHPAPPYTLTRVATWRNLEAGNRMVYPWPQAFYGFLSSHRFTPQAIQIMLGGLWSHGHYIFEHPAGLRRPSNWSIVDSSGLAAVSLYFPEFADAGQWREAAFERLTYQMNLQVYDDGAQYELAPGYHLYCLDRFRNVLDILPGTEHAFPPDFIERAESMYDYVMWLVKPDRTLPLFSDTTGPINAAGLLREGATRFGRDDMRYVATNGSEGAPPATASHMSPYAGYATMRSGWEPDALYLCLDGGPVGTGHQHEDKLSFMLSAYGVNFVVDSGPHHYTPTKWRKHCVSSASHSVVLVDGLGQYRIESREEHLAADEPDPVWQSNERFDYTTAVYDKGFGVEKLPVTHRRHVFFKKPEYWVIIDELGGEGQHEVTTLFQFAPDLRLDTREEGVLSAESPRGPVLHIRPGFPAGLEVEVVTGREEPTIQGWYAPRGEILDPAPTACYHIDTDLPFVQAYLLYPARDESSAIPGLLLERDDAVLRVEVDSGAKRDVISIDTSERRAALEE